jgi:predicted Zn-dependent peptidase
MGLDAQVTRLDNGLRVATIAMPGIESVAMGIWVGVGGRHEPAILNGISHFIEHLLFKGTQRRTAREISEAIEGRGGYFNAFTQEESTCYYARVASEHAADVFEILADMYHQPRFAAEDIERERGVILEEISMYNDQPAHVAEELLHGLMWPNHPLGRPLTGTESVVRRISRTDIVAFKEARYRPTQTLAIFAGAIDARKARAMTADMMGHAPHGRLARAHAAAPLRQHRFAAKQRKIEQAHVAVGFRTFSRHDPRRYALKLLSVILGENMSSRLFQTVREKYGLAYSIQSGLSLFADTGAFFVTAGVDVERAPKALRAIASELSRITRAKVGPKELQRAKDYTIGQLRLGLESSGERLLWVGEHLLGFGRAVEPEEYVQKFAAVTPEDVQSVARSIIQSPNMSMAVVAPFKEATARTMFEDDFTARL